MAQKSPPKFAAPALLKSMYKKMRLKDASPFTKDRPLRVGTDCSGIEAPIVALEQLGVPFSHEFSSEIDKQCIATIRANFKPKIIFEDMTKRHLKDVPDIDLYVCGFPCQPFSAAGKRDGVRDPRGTVFWECLKVIRSKKPMMFMLENVRGLLSIDNGETFRQMIRELERLKQYRTTWKVLDTADYGVPQSRKRVFIVGVAKARSAHLSFAWPSPRVCHPLSCFVKWEDRSPALSTLTARDSAKLVRTNPNALFVDLAFYDKSYPNAHLICPCQCAQSRFWNTPLRRPMNLAEAFALQGFPEPLSYAGGDARMKKMLGNSISVNVVCHLFANLLSQNHAA